MAKSIKELLRSAAARAGPRPSILTVVPPSGRQPRPISCAFTGEHPFDGRPLSVTFSYAMDYIRPRHRRAVRSWVRDRGFVSVREARSSDLKTAFKIHRIQEPVEVIDVVQFEDDLWWSLPGQPGAAQFAAALAAGEHTAVGLLDEGLVTTARVLPSLDKSDYREIVRDHRDDAVARLNKGAQGVLIVDGHHVFLREASPLYVLWDGSCVEINGNNRGRVMRALHSVGPQPAFEDLTNALAFGRIFGPQYVEEAKALAEQTGASLAVQAAVEVILPELIRNSPVEVQIDAVFRKLLRLVLTPRPVQREALVEIRSILNKLQALQGPNTSSKDRALGLKSFVEWCDVGVRAWTENYRVERRFVNDAVARIEAECLRSCSQSPFIPNLTQEDELAITEFAT